jgi:hypothetical protein
MNPMIVFFHIPKTAGTSVREQIIFHLNIKAEKRLDVRDVSNIAYMSNQVLNSFDIISGHIGIQLLNRIERPTVKFIFLRNPVARTRSQYQYLKKLAAKEVSSNGHFSTVLRGRTLKELLNDKSQGSVNSLFRNTQTWTLVKDYQERFRKLEMAHSDVLEIAKENLEQMDCFGIVEYMDESFELLNAKFGWSLQNNVFANLSEYDKESPEDKETDRMILEQNKLDADLYEWACLKFAQQSKMRTPFFLQNSDDVKQNVFDTEKNAASSLFPMETWDYSTLPKAVLIERLKHAEESMKQVRQLTGGNQAWDERTEEKLAAEREISAGLRDRVYALEQILLGKKGGCESGEEDLKPQCGFSRLGSRLHEIFERFQRKAG